MKKLVVFVLMLLSVNVLEAQDFNTLLNPNSAANFAPFNFTSTRKIRTIYRPSDFVVAANSGQITTVYVASASGSGGGTWTDFTISLGQTTDTALTSTSFTNSLTTCLNAPSFTVTGVSSNAYIAFPLTTPFTFDASQSLIVEISYLDRTSTTGFAVRSNTLSGQNISLSAATQSSTTGTYSASQRTLGIDVQTPQGVDLALTNFSSPLAPFSPQTAVPVAVNFQNAGSITISTAQFNYQYGNGPVVSETFSGSVASFQGGSFSFTTPFTIPSAGDSNLRVWVSTVNGAADLNQVNDTIIKFLCLPLPAGNYAVGGPTADFADIPALQDRLNCSGIGGAVIFELAAGVYQGPFRFNQITGANAANTVAFTSATGNPADVKFYPPAGNEEALSFDGSQYVTLSGLTFVRVAAVSGATPLLLLNETSNMNLFGLVFLDSIRTVSANNIGMSMVSGSSNLLQNIRTEGFGSPLRLTGSSTSPGVANRIANSDISRYLLVGLYALNQTFLSVENNRISNYQGNANAGTGLEIASATDLLLQANRIGGSLGARAMLLTNLAGSGPGAMSRVINNELTGFTYTANGNNTGSIGVSIVGDPQDGQDAVLFAHNSVSVLPLGTNTPTSYALLSVSHGTGTVTSFDSLVIINNNLAEPSFGTNSPTDYKVMRFSTNFLASNAVIANNNYYRPAENALPHFISVASPVADFISLQTWQAAFPNDTNSISVRPYFLADSLLVPLSLALDNKGIPLAGIATDLQGNLRDFITPDIGAYEFTGQSIAQFQFTPLTNTLDTSNRSVVVVINDSLGLATGINGPRMYYRKGLQGVFLVDDSPVIQSNQFTFEVSSTLLGGISGGDTIFYYFAVLNNAGVVTTLPLGGSGAAPVGLTPPSSLFSYEVVPSAQGTYTVGLNGDFATITAAASFMNTATFTGTATFVLIDTLYSSNEIFPINILANASRTQQFRAVLRPDSGVTARVLAGIGATNPAMFKIEDAAHFDLLGNWAGDSVSRLSLQLSNANTGTAMIWLAGNNGAGNEDISIGYTRFTGFNAETNPQYGLYLGGGSVTATGEGENRGIRLHNNRFERLWQGVYVRGRGAALATDVQILNNYFGSEDVSFNLAARGIQLHNTDSSLVEGNVMRNIRSSLSVQKAGVETGGTHSQLIIRRNDIREVAHTAFSGITQGAYGIYLNGGSGIEISNNIIAGMRGGNVGNASYSAAMGIRLASGNSHKLYYNTVHMFGEYDQPASGGASAAALGITSTAVNNLDVRNNIFSNTLSSVSSSTGVYLVAIWVAQNYSFASSTFDNNAYAVRNNSQNLVARFGNFLGQLYLSELSDLQVYTQAGNATNDINSIPAVGKVPTPFVSDTVLSIDPMVPTPYESGGVVIAGLGTPNIDLNGLSRPAFGGLAPDLGAVEFDGLVAVDDEAPTVRNFALTPGFLGCTPASRSLRLNAEDETGVDSAIVLYRINSGAYQGLTMTLDSGTVLNGRWIATIPAGAAGDAVHVFVRFVDQLGNATDSIRLGTFRDAYLAVTASNDTTLLGGSLYPHDAKADAGGLVLSEVFYNRVLTGAQPNFPTGFPTSSSQVAFELTNTSLWPVDLSGLQLKMDGFFAHAVTLPSLVLQSGELIMMVAGTSANQPANGIYGLANSSGGTSPFNSSNQMGFWIENPATREVIDAVAVNDYQFRQASGVTGFDFTGSVNAANRASIQREGDDTNLSTDWTASSATFNSSVGLVNSTLTIGPGTYEWALLSGGPVLSTGPTGSFTPTVTGDYVLRFSDGTCTVSDTFNITVNAPDLALVSFISPMANDVVRDPVEVRFWVKNVGNTLYQAAANFSYSVNGALPTGPVSENLSLNPGDSVAVRIAPDWIPQAAGNYEICAYVQAVPGDINRVNDSLCVAINSAVSVVESAFSKVVVYPNPANELVMIKGLLPATHILITNATGQRVFEHWVMEEEAIRLATENWAAGLYHLELSSKEHRSTRKFMVVK